MPIKQISIIGINLTEENTMKIYERITDLVGKTPLVKLPNYSEKRELEAAIAVKVEAFNPAGSVKDRIAKAMLDDAEAKGLVNKDTVGVVYLLAGADNRTYQRKHRNRTRGSFGFERIQNHSDHAGDNER